MCADFCKFLTFAFFKRKIFTDTFTENGKYQVPAHLIELELTESAILIISVLFMILQRKFVNMASLWQWIDLVPVILLEYVERLVDRYFKK